MTIRTALIAACGALALCALPAQAQAPSSPPAGRYTVDKAHTSVNFRVSHIGMSFFTARFTGIDATLDIDPADPAAAQVSATIDAHTLQTNYPFKDLDFDAMIEGDGWLEADKYPTITFRSTKVTPTGPNTADITGELTLHGVTKPVVLAATYNGGYAGHPLDPNARIGFSAHGTFKRSDFGVDAGIPAPGSTMGVGDEVEVIIETELTRPKEG